MTLTGNPSLALSGKQRQIIWIAWGTYAAFYLGRLNLSPALPSIAESLDIGLGRVGLLGTVFFWSYALGQFVNGQLGNIIPPRRIILIGLLVIAVSNAVFAFQMTLWAMAIVWAVNGFAQASGWGPMLRIVSSHLDVTQKQRVSTLLSMSFQFGVAISWGLASMLLLLGDWRFAFWVPAAILMVVAVMWRFGGIDIATSDSPPASTLSVTAMIQEIRQLFPMLIVSMCIGFVYIGFLLWLPTFIQTRDFLPIVFVQGITLIAPLLGIPGMWLAGEVLARRRNVLGTLIIFLTVLLGLLLASALIQNSVQLVFVLLAMFTVSGLAGLVLSSAPMLLTTPDRVSSAGGLITMTWSLSGGVAGTVIGSAVDIWGWTSVFFIWCGMILLAMGAVWYASVKM